jgi:hypothetical protein
VNILLIVIQVVAIVSILFLLVATASGAVAMPLALLLAVPALLAFRFTWKRMKAPPGG